MKSGILTKTSFNNYSNEIQRSEWRTWSLFLTHKFLNQTLTHLRKRKRDNRRGIRLKTFPNKKKNKTKNKTRGRRTKTDEDRLLWLELVESVWWKIYFIFFVLLKIVLFRSAVILQVAVQGQSRRVCAKVSSILLPKYSKNCKYKQRNSNSKKVNKNYYFMKTKYEVSKKQF